jgi:Histidine kinase-, DNA gyrase B-, and HSP90-like ATPase
MTRVTVKVESDHLEKLARPSRRLAGIAEMIWNAVDAEAEVVEVRVLENALQGVDSVEVNDNGHGMTQAEALKAFELRASVAQWIEQRFMKPLGRENPDSLN